MSRFVLRSFWFFAVLAFSGLLGPAAVAAQSAAFQANITISEEVGPALPGCYFHTYITGAGQASHLGNVAVNAHDCVNPIGPTTFAFVATQGVITAANGDQLYITYGGTLNIVTGAVSGIYVISRGTGRFAEATGEGIVQGVEDISTNPARGQIQLKGTISY